jgi:hypothetical protein
MANGRDRLFCAADDVEQVGTTPRRSPTSGPPGGLAQPPTPVTVALDDANSDIVGGDRPRRPAPIVQDDGALIRTARAREEAARRAAAQPPPPAEDGPRRGEGFGVRLRGQTERANAQGDFSALGRAGTWIDPQDDKEYSGVRVRGGFTGDLSSRDPNNPDNVHGSLLSVDAGIYSNDETLTIGAGASLADFNFTSGQDFSDQRDDDLALTGHAGVGPGVALRIHHGGDRDNDGNPELGFGISAMDFGFDVRSETLGRYARNARRNITRWGERMSSWFDDPAPAGTPTPGDPVV